MTKKLLKMVAGVLVLGAFAIRCSGGGDGGAGNAAPEAPMVPTGEAAGMTNEPYSFASGATDPDGDPVALMFDWGDGETSDWSAAVASGELVSLGHQWTSAGVYPVRARARDDAGALSDWSAEHLLEIALAWSRTYGGSAADTGNAVQQTTDGGYVVVGTTLSYSASEAVYLMKMDANGELAWTRTFGGQSPDLGNAVQQTSDGGYILVGTTSSFGGTDRKIYVVKTDAGGNQQWYRTKGFDAVDEEGFSVQQTSDGGYIILGYTEETLDKANTVFLVKIDGSGNTQWYKKFGYDRYDDEGYSVQQTSDGGYILAGEIQTSRVTNDDDVFLVKTDALGITQWYQLKGFDHVDDKARSVQQTSDGGYIVAGVTEELDSDGDVFLIKTDGAGNTEWYRTFGGPAADVGRAVRQTPDGGYVIAGECGGDVCLIKTDAAGAEVWSRSFGGIGYDVGRSVQLTTDGGYVVAGSTSSYGQGQDVFLIKTDRNGNTHAIVP